jgi:hypothetical protein
MPIVFHMTEPVGGPDKDFTFTDGRDRNIDIVLCLAERYCLLLRKLWILRLGLPKRRQITSTGSDLLLQVSEKPMTLARKGHDQAFVLAIIADRAAGR